ncbi:helix-turn-helix transcriptional regulator [Dawidia soli]|uniref:AraC family transcriptional regulator n=1 Tax=Dawidia soli TaxID=2782352 RepID=A0AAP2GK14_9BACT|nr:AraC family transcriptional regulator [Dawidia soli]MBT1689961.1 AraC family transcriptional regulator [Dawidia soli]
MRMRLTDTRNWEPVYERTYPDNFHAADGIEDHSIDFDHAGLGAASVREIWFEGVHLNFGKSRVKGNTTLHFESDTPVIEMHFGLAGTAHSARVNNLHDFVFQPQQHNIFYMPGFEGYLKTGRQEVLHEVFEVHFTEAYFKRLAHAPYTLLEKFLEQMDRGNIVMMSRNNRLITPAMTRLIHDIRTCERTGVFKRLYLEAKVLELLLLQIEQFMQEGTVRETASLKRCDHDKLYHAKYLLEQHRDAPYSLQTLAREVGLNDFKLKKGFKEMFGNTVFGYLHDLRMEEARQLLLDSTGKPIHEIASYCGYEHAQHFTRSFKKKYGITPGSLRNNK